MRPSDFAAAPEVVAPGLLNKVIVCGAEDSSVRAGRIVEVEAYGGSGDSGSHGSRGMTKRNEAMFGPPGRLYVYFTYGMHWCANIVCDSDGVCGAVLLRALEPLWGVEQMRQVRPKARRLVDLCSGPAKLTQALGITGEYNGIELGADAVLPGDGMIAPPCIVVGPPSDAVGPVSVVDDGTAPPTKPVVTERIGVSRGREKLWRWCVPGNPHVSR